MYQCTHTSSNRNRGLCIKKNLPFSASVTEATTCLMVLHSTKTGPLSFGVYYFWYFPKDDSRPQYDFVL